ncbi:MAG: hypothetical protein KC442_03835 [Thermomicrobiales bacterium]|nr:hypothetical protein [Thermomicrobiales bacterium]
MDTNRFDALARQFGSRRSVLGGLATVLAAIAATPGDPAQAKKKKKKHKKKKCKKGALRCGKKCVDAHTDSQNCGGCGVRCASGTACVNGSCVGTPSCPVGQMRCDGLCVNPASNEDHCGQCGNTCRLELTCIEGQCGCATEGETACPGDSCVDLKTDDDNCGACGHACPSGQHCQNGECAHVACDPGQRLCNADSTCIPDNDDQFCCNQADCGGSGSDLECVDHVCVCKTAGTGRCPSPNRNTCSICCGGVGVGERCGPSDADWVNVCYSATGSTCTCPPGKVTCRFNNRRCSLDPQTDSNRCGDNCYVCDEYDPGSACCFGSCSRGCNPGTSCGNGPNLIACPANNCQPCPPGTLCCNNGPGTAARCVKYNSAFCPPKDYVE